MPRNVPVPQPARRPQTTAVHRVFHALGDPTRRTIVEKLGEGPLSATQLAGPLKLTVAAVVQHLQVLAASDLVWTEKTGRVRICRMNPQGLALMQHWIDARRAMWEERFDQLGELLAEADE